jgi:protein-L-isoaspartate(D-aspartate) O-methyltransferase
MRAVLMTATLLAGCAEAPAKPNDYATHREAMVRDQIAARGVRDARVLAAMRKVPRHEYVPPLVRHKAYADHPLPIGDDQTISQPYIVARMTELAEVKPAARVLEVGTGSGYQAAILAELAAEVYTIEIVPTLARTAAQTLRAQGYERVRTRTGDGWRGWPEAAPFDAILVTASPDEVPPALKDQLKDGGRLVIPVKDELLVITRRGTRFETVAHDPVRFVPMTGEAQKR